MPIRCLCLLLFNLIGLVFPARSADIAWSDPMVIETDSDVLTIGELDRACNFGATQREIIVSGVNFRMFGGTGELKAGTESLSDGRTTVLVSSAGDGFTGDINATTLSTPGISADYSSLIQSRLVNRGYPVAVILDGLTIGKSYILQWWTHDDSTVTPAAQILTGGNKTSIPFEVNSAKNASGLGSHIVGVFTADNTKQVVTCTPLNGSAELSALQLRVIRDDFTIAILKQPVSTTNYLSKSISLRVVALSDKPLRFQWQKITTEGTNDLVDDGRIVGAKSSLLQINSLTLPDAASYRVLVHSSEEVASEPASLTILEPRTNQIINVAISNGSTAAYFGKAVLDGSPQDIWNNIDGRGNFTTKTLVDASGRPTSITLSVAKSDGGSVPQGLLRCVSFASHQTVTISNLQPEMLYHLVVFSVGNMANEGGVFSGAIEGICRGYPAANTPATGFLFETNFLENPYALSDAQGTLKFVIKPNSTAFSGGHTFGDFNGLQLTKAKPGPPIFLRSPVSIKARPKNQAALTALAASPPTEYRTHIGMPSSGSNVAGSAADKTIEMSFEVGQNRTLRELAGKDAFATAYQWQKLQPRSRGSGNTSSQWMDLTENESLSETTNASLIFRSIAEDHAGSYRVIGSNRFGSATGSVVSVSVLTNRLFNVSITEGSLPPRNGTAVLEGTDSDRWNAVDGRKAFTNATLVDAEGNTTPVTLTLSKTNGGAVRQSLLGGVSFGTHQTVTISNLPGYESFHLVVFSVGNMPNEGGVFTGAVKGICRGFPDPKHALGAFISGTNYLSDPYVMSDFKGTISFSVAANSTAFSGGHTFCDINGFQLIQVPPGPPVMLQQPSSIAAVTGSAIRLDAKAKGPPSSKLSYRWQKIDAGKTNDLVDTINVSGTTNAFLLIRSLTPANNGLYRVVASNQFGSVASQPVTVTAVQNQLINVAVNNGSTPPYVGRAVFDGTPNDIWNRPDGRTSFADFPLVDSSGARTPITLSLSKSDGSAVRNALLGGVSFSKSQTVTVKNLLPNETYHLVVFSVGNMPNEGGVFNGAVEGICRGYPVANTVAKDFVLQTNYLENLEATSDVQGAIAFTVTPNSSAFPEGHTFGDFNGLQLTRGISQNQTKKNAF